jgi:hypothetical protein
MINPEKLYAYMEKFHGPVSNSTNNWYECCCPICGKQKFTFSTVYKIGKCWRGCINSFIIDSVMLYHGISCFEAYELIDQQEPGLLYIPAVVKRQKDARIKLPNGYHPILEGNTNLAHRAREYLLGRNFDLNYMDRLGVGYCADDDPDPKFNFLGYIIIPFKRNGLLSYFIGRDFIGNYQRYKNPEKSNCGVGVGELLFNEEALLMQRKIYLVEGWSCAATIGPCGTSQQGAVPSLIQKNTIIKSGVEEVIIVPDAGYYVNGLTAARDIMKSKKVKVVNLDWFLESGIGKDIAEIGKENLLLQEEKTPWMDPMFLYKQFKVYADKKIVIK